MIDRPALAEALVKALYERDIVTESTALLIVARVLAEHETTWKAEATRSLLRGTLKGYQAGENAPSKLWRERAEAAEARCAHLEQERENFHMAYRIKCDVETKALHTQLAQAEAHCVHLEAEHERLRAALVNMAARWRNDFTARYEDSAVCAAEVEAALAPSQEPIK